MREFILELEKEAGETKAGSKAVKWLKNKWDSSTVKTIHKGLSAPGKFVGSVGKGGFAALDRWPVLIPAAAAGTYGGVKYYKYKKQQAANTDPAEYLTASDYQQ
jgi:hypothetical protein